MVFVASSETKHRFVPLAGKRVERGSLISTASIPLARAAAIASAVSRNGASVVQLGPTWAGTPVSCNARFAAEIKVGSASAKSSGGGVMVARPSSRSARSMTTKYGGDPADTI